MGVECSGVTMKKVESVEKLRKGIASLIEDYIDSMDISEKKMDQIVNIAADIYGKIKATGHQTDGEKLAMVLYLIANQAEERPAADPYEFAGYA